MKKALKILGVLTLLFSLFANLGFSALEVVHAADTANITLHKKMMDTLPSPLLQNTGDVDARFDAYENYTDGVTFSVYDVSNDYYAARDGGATVDAALAAVQALDVSGRTALATDLTDTNGEAQFTLDKFDGNDRHAVYLFVETPKAGVTVAANMLLMFPVYRMNADGSYTDVELEDVHLYPKNIVSKGDLAITKRGTADNALLSGAEFIIQSNETDRYLVGVANGFFTWSDNIANAFKFLTGRNYGIGASAITNAAGSAGLLNVAGLIPGSYKLLETNAPTNAAIIDAENNRDFNIVAGATTATSFTVMNDTILVDKDIVGDKLDYNVGDSIPYAIKVNIPDGMGDRLANNEYKHPSMIITDEPDAGLQFRNIKSIFAGSIEIDLADVTMNTTGNGFIMTLPAALLAETAGEELTIEYNMYLDGLANPDLDYNNTANVTTSRITDNDDGPEVFTGGKRYIKVDKDSNGNALPGATFVVRNGNGADALYLAIDDVTQAVTWVANLAGAEEFLTGADGIIDIRGLDFGTYYLEEIEAPADFIIVDELIEFEIFAGSYLGETGLVDPATVVNIRKGRLPSTGGSGIMGIVGVGLVLITTTGGYYMKRRRDA